MINSEFVEIAVEAPLPRLLTYRLPQNLSSQVIIGSRVLVPLGPRKSKGVLVSEIKSSSALAKGREIKPIIEIIDEPALGDKMRLWLKWLAQYYLHPPGQVYSMAFSPGLEIRKRKGRKKAPTDLNLTKQDSHRPFTPNEDQQKAISKIGDATQNTKFQPFLLWGVTGSGKTEVYLQCIEKVVKSPKQALVLVPEISLTPQLVKRFVGRFGENVAVLHSHLTERERSDQWWSVVRGKKQILVGARSALFCPVENLGIIIVDEEHEASFKQENNLKYNARDSAIVRAQISSCPIVLGSATPSLESWQNSLSGKFQLLELKSRVENRPLPTIQVVDMRKHKPSKESTLPFWLSQSLFEELNAVLEKNEQAALFLNRRGFAQFTLCPSCGHTEQCAHCSVSLTVHKQNNKLLCHYCAFEKPMVVRCPSCKSDEMRTQGLGTQRIAEDLGNLFSSFSRPINIARADRDEINSRESLEKLLDDINNHTVDIIVGTQMIAKGHDFPNLTLVGAVMADLGLHFPDFRSSEKTFQLLTQVAGRAGRHEKAGKVVIQTYSPHHPAISCSANHDFRKFAGDELRERSELQYPPFGRMATLRFQGADFNKTEATSQNAMRRLEHLKKNLTEYSGVEFLGPCESALAKLKNKHRFQILMKVSSSKTLNTLLQHFMRDSDWVPSGVGLSVDVDPLYLL